MKDFVLNNGAKIPAIGLGTWLIPDDKVANVIVEAVKLGYRHIDTAQAYRNERGVGDGIKRCGLPREELFITTKIAAEIKSYQKAYDSVIESMKKLDLDYIDLVIIHCPQPWVLFRSKIRYFKQNVQVWKALERLYKEGKVRAIGVSNFAIDDLENIFNHCEIKPMINQFLLHIGETPCKLIEFCQNNDVVVEAYSPLGHGRDLKDKDIQKIADKYHVSTAAMCVKYCYDLDTVVLPKASSHDHLLDNLNINFDLAKEDLDYLLSLNKSKE